jgi:putative phosphoribosyl transferase
MIPAQTPTETAEPVVRVPIGTIHLEGNLTLPAHAAAVVLFAHGSGSSRHSPRNTFVARQLQQAGLGTLLLDLLTAREDESYATRFDIGLLTDRLVAATGWLRQQPATKRLAVGYFGASTGAAAALDAAARLGDAVGAVVSRGGRPDLATSLEDVKAPTLLIVGSFDPEVLVLNRQAFDHLTCPRELTVIPGATHLFEEPGTLEEVARLAASWFARHLGGRKT